MSRMDAYQNNVQPFELRRLYVLYWIFFVLLLGVIIRSFSIQVWNRYDWITSGNTQYEQRVPLKAKRGLIYDRDMNILCMDLPISSLAIDPYLMKQKEHVQSIASIINMSANEIEKNINTHPNSRFIRLSSELDPNQLDILEKSEIPGLIHMQELKRVYPYKHLGKSLLGITNKYHEGVGGVEQAFNDVLRGEDGWTIYQKDGLNRHFASIDYPVEQPLNGNHLILTINHTYQSVIEEELYLACEKHDAASGSAVMMDPYTGEVLSMVSRLRKKPKNPDEVFNASILNQALQITYEPGSSFKIVAVAAALEEKIIEPTTLFHCENGEYSLANQIIHDHNKSYEWLTVQQIMEYSSNIGMVKIGRKLGKKKFYQYIRDFGFGNCTGIGLPGEAKGLLLPVYKWDDFTAAAMAFGQGLSVNTLQLACMTAAIANGGLLVQPHILRAILNEDVSIHQFEPKVIRRVISEETAVKLRAILSSVVENGSAAKARVDGLQVAGKTGTAEKSVPGYKGYLPGAHVSSFVGFWPVKRPRYVLVLVLNEPQKVYWASRSTAPLFSRIVNRISGIPEGPSIRELKPVRHPSDGVFSFSSLKKENPQKKQVNNNMDQASIPNQIPNLYGLSLRQALQKLAQLNIEARVLGNGRVVHQDLKAGMLLNGERVCVLTCESLDD